MRYRHVLRLLYVAPRTSTLILDPPYVAGVDEVGRGPLAGPVVAAAVILPEVFDSAGIRDSKALSPTAREAAAARIRQETIWALGLCSPQEIDRLNILEASMEAMRRALAALNPAPKMARIDGSRLPRGLQIAAETVVKGDAKHLAIAAASILAKVHRDTLMAEAAATYPEFGFERNFGYPTPDHLEALRRHGPCPIHRTSFAPVQLRLQPCLNLDLVETGTAER